MIRRPPRSTLSSSSAASDVYKRQVTSRLLLTRMLETWGYEVTATKDGAEALQELQAEDAPRLAILDWMMPGMDGVDVCRRLRTRETLQPPYIILLTALGDTESVVTVSYTQLR